MVTWPSGKAKVCKTFIHQFKSGRHLHKTVMKKLSQSFFFVVASKISDFANQFLDTVLQCCPTILGRFAHLDSHFSADFWNLAGEGAIFLRKNRINPAVFRMFSISSQPISCWLRGFFCFFRQFSFCFQVFHFIPIYNKEDFHHEHGLDNWGGSYGYYIQIDHGGGLETLYAHCSSICVATSQQVQAGQVIGYVGHTGRVTGSHLHLETRVNGSRVDSMQFFS